MAATAAAALLHRGGLRVDAASAAAPVVGREWSSSTVRDLQGLEEKQPSRVVSAEGHSGALVFTFHNHLTTGDFSDIKRHQFYVLISAHCLHRTKN